MSGQLGLLRVVSNDDITKRDELAAAELRSAQLAMRPAYIESLASLVNKRFTEAKDARRTSGIYDRLLRCMYQRRGEYTEQELVEIRSAGGGSEVYSKITAAKVRMLSAWIRDTYLSSERPFTAKPSPVPDVPHMVDQNIQMQLGAKVFALREQGVQVSPQDIREAYNALKEEVLAHARKAAKDTSRRMEDRMQDVMLAGGWYAAMDACIDDLCTFPIAVMKGPTIRRRRQMNWVPKADGAGFEPKVEDTYIYAFSRVSPFSFYPSPGAEDPQNCLYVCEEHKLLPGDLSALLGVPGYNDDAIREILSRMDSNGNVRTAGIMTEISSQRARLEDKSVITEITPEGVTAVEMWGSVPGKILREYGMGAAEVPDVDIEYEVNVWVVADLVVKAVINPDPLRRRPYSVVPFEPVPGSLWGLALPELIEDMQRGANSALRALANNMAMASGPQVQIDVGRMAPGEPVPTVRPWQRWVTDSNQGLGGATTPPVAFFQPPSNAQELIMVYQAFSSIADEISSLPKYMGGDQHVGGAGRTASGLAMLMSSASKAIRQLIWRVDSKLLTPQLERLFYYLMKFDADDSIKGDMEVIARGASVVAQEETQRMRLMEFLQVTANPIDQSIVGPEVRADILREVARRMDTNISDRMPTGEQFLAKQAQQMQQMQQMPPGMPQPGQGAMAPQPNAQQMGAPDPQMGPGQIFPPGTRM